MAKIKIENMKSSEILRIEAAMMEKAEKVASDVEMDGDLMPAKAEGKLMMTLRFPKISLDGIIVLRDELKSFTVDIFGKGKSGFFIAVVGSVDAFKSLNLPAPTSPQPRITPSYNRP